MALSLTVPSGTFHLSGNPLFVKITGAVAPAGATNYKVLCKVTSTDGELVGGPFIDAKAPDSSDEALFDVSGYVDQPLDKVFEFPLSGGLVPYNSQTLDITLTPGESYIDSNGDLQENWGTASEGNFVVKGGVGFRKLGEYNDLSSSFYADYVTGAKFLTHMPTGQVVHPYQPAKLWFLAAAGGSKDVKIKAYYDDGSSYTYTSAHTFYLNIMHEINCLPYHASAENMPPVKTGNAKMTYYEVWIDTLTEKYLFTVDHTYHEQCNFLFAFNSLGGVDCVWLSGEVAKGYKTEMVQAIRPFPAAGTAKDRTLVVAARTGQRLWKINTGYKSKTEIEALKDLLLSKQVWLLEDAGTYNSGTLHPVIIENTGADLYDSTADLYSLDLEISEAHSSQFV
jgi:hypothetical protein